MFHLRALDAQFTQRAESSDEWNERKSVGMKRTWSEREGNAVAAECVAANSASGVASVTSGTESAIASASSVENAEQMTEGNIAAANVEHRAANVVDEIATQAWDELSNILVSFAPSGDIPAPPVMNIAEPHDYNPTPIS